ncbi:ubiquinol-cytochrome c reductase iron-sulfur subunit [Rhodospirillum centenum]|uniref:Ubiquinol-cytochrome c reductase iron-sulfur subunit n=1 Tax=Rhodospirillum centenum (strain ATCC 51521 / SW) TaxID=414684 RepID=B6IUK3_RHOCS|nr:ubiquinol-cytochrome c reductase iron-sulfur subunit [Rhodospirillum centenum]ACI99828.1 rieske iron-sulfur protein [Rhodospirillum centenum SW]
MTDLTHPGPMGTGQEDGDPSRRDILVLGTIATGAVGAAIAAWPFIDSLNPASDTLSLASIEVDLSPIAEGQAITVTWRGKPVFVRHRTAAEIELARKTDLNSLIDPQPDTDRVKEGHEQWLIAIGICTHLGCVPMGQKSTDPRGDYGGWFCPCHGSHYDTAGRIRKGPAPLNLALPDYAFLDDTRIRIG